MNKRLLAAILGVVLSLNVAASAWAEYVYVTKNGKKYHHAESRFIKNKETEKITLEEAIARGLEPSKAYLKAKEEGKTAEPSNVKK